MSLCGVAVSWRYLVVVAGCGCPPGQTGLFPELGRVVAWEVSLFGATQLHYMWVDIQSVRDLLSRRRSPVVLGHFGAVVLVVVLLDLLDGEYSENSEKDVLCGQMQKKDTCSRAPFPFGLGSGDDLSGF